MWKRLRVPKTWLVSVTSCALAAGCTETPRLDGAATRLVAGLGAMDECLSDAIRPSAVPPAEGVWSGGGSDGSRVAVMIGPVEIRAGSTVIIRRVEAVETDPKRSVGLRTRSDTAVMRLDLLSPYGALRRSSIERDTSRARQSAAVYAITPLVLVAAYEPCSASAAPAIRYLRRDSRGRIAVDAMLRRETGSGNQ